MMGSLFNRVAASGLAFVLTLVSAWVVEAKRPNIVFILVDDIGMETMDGYGGTSWPTPAINTIREHGMLFEQAFSCPSCAPTRAQFLTGRYPFRTKVLYPTLPKGPLADDEMTLATLLKQAGYKTGLGGKWNLRYGSTNEASRVEQSRHIEAHGFEEHMAFLGHTIQYGNPTNETEYVPHQLNEWACEFVKKHANEEAPFYLQYSMGLVHFPLSATPLNPGETSTDFSKEHLHGFMMKYMDQMVGNLLNTLEASCDMKNTVILFSGDNGTLAGIKSMFRGKEVVGGKLSMKDTGSWVPLYVRWDGVVEPGSRYDGMTDFSDLFPTLLEIGGVPLPQDRGIDGRSFLAQLKGETRPHRDMVFVSHRDKAFVRDQHWKLKNGKALFDVSNSPFEEKPIPMDSGDPDAEAARVRLKKYYETLK